MELTENEIKQIIYECLEKLVSLGPEFVIEHDVHVNLNFFDATGTLGQCGFGIDANGNFVQEISFNKHLMKDCLKDIIINSVYHEFCHYFQNKEAVRTGYYYKKPDGKWAKQDSLSLQNYFEGDDEGHGDCWLKYANKVNAVLKPNIPVTAHPTKDDFAYFIDTNKDKIIFTIYCTSCDRKDSFISFTDYDLNGFPLGLLTAIIKSQEENKENNYCYCGGSLKIKAKSQEILYNILKKEQEVLFTLLLRGELKYE